MLGYSSDIETLTLENTNFRKVLATTNGLQLTLMSLLPGEDIGREKHHVVQFFRFESGIGIVELDNAHGEKETFEVQDGSAVIVPKGTYHNIINTSDRDYLKLYTIYTGEIHNDGQIDVLKPKQEDVKSECILS